MRERRPWTAEDQQAAEELRLLGCGYKEIGKLLGRSHSLVRCRLNPAAAQVHREASLSYRQRNLDDCRRRQRESRRQRGRPTGSKHGLPHRYQEDVLGRRAGKGQSEALARLVGEGWEPEAIRSFLDGWTARQKAIARAGRVTVASLVAQAQRAAPRVRAPEEEEAWLQRQRTIRLAAYHHRMATDESFRLAVRNRSKTRKLRLARAHVGDTSGTKIRERFALFGDACAYCGRPGSDSRLQVEHIIPISRGGPHAMANIVPACKRCNDSKFISEVESWYRRQPFFSQQRWALIQQCMGKARGRRASDGQLPLL